MALVCVAISIAAAVAFAETLHYDRSGLRTIEVGAGHAPFILLHGYGSSPKDLVPFTQTVLLSPRMRFVFPEAPARTTPPDGPEDGRSWWKLELASYLRPGETLPDMSRSRPSGLDESSGKVRTLLKEIHDRQATKADETILGGFSQGAMIAGDIAFTTDEPLRALVILSGTVVDEAAWTRGLPRRAGLPVFIAHGRNDSVLPFDAAARLADRMEHAGLRVTWVPFEGGHEIPAEVVTTLNVFLAGIGAGPG